MIVFSWIDSVLIKEKKEAVPYYFRTNTLNLFKKNTKQRMENKSFNNVMDSIQEFWKRVKGFLQHIFESISLVLNSFLKNDWIKV